MKKVFAIVLIVCLAMTAVFADKGDFKVGAQVGLGTYALSVTKDSNNYVKSNNSGFYFAGTGEYFFSDAFAGRFEFGLNTMGKAKSAASIAGISTSGTADEASPAMLSAYVGAEYGFELSDTFDLLVGAGWDMMIGKESNADDAKTNAAMGIGLEVVCALELQKNLDLTFGAKYGIFFVNTDDDIADAYSTFAENDCKVSNSAFKVFVGVTYTL